MSDELRQASRILASADHEQQLSAAEEWLTVKEFAARVNMHERSVREAIRKGRLASKFRVERVTEGKHQAIRIVMPRAAA